MNDQSQQPNPGLDAMRKMEFEQFKKWQAEQQGKKEDVRQTADGPLVAGPGEPNGYTQNMLTNIRAILVPSVAIAVDQVSDPTTRRGGKIVDDRSDELLDMVVGAVRTAVPVNPNDPADALRNMTWVEVRTEMIAVLRTLADRLDNANGNATRRSETTTGPTEPAFARANPYAPSAN